MYHKVVFGWMELGMREWESFKSMFGCYKGMEWLIPSCERMGIPSQNGWKGYLFHGIGMQIIFTLNFSMKLHKAMYISLP